MHDVNFIICLLDRANALRLRLYSYGTMTADMTETHTILGNSIHDMKARSAQMERVEIPMDDSNGNR